MERRDFIKVAGLGVTAGLGGWAWAGEDQPRIRRYRPLGRTGLQISDISLGSYGGLSPRVIERALGLGINYFDTAPDYRGEGVVSEESLGKVFASPEKRDKVALATKMCAGRNYPAHWPRGTPVDQIVQGVEESLKRLRTDRIDVLLLHGVGELEDGDQERIKDSAALEAFARLKKAGKARFLGMGCHGPRQMVQTVEWAVDSGQYDLVQVAYNFFAGTDFSFRDQGLDRVIAKAGEKGVGVIAMKTRAGAGPEQVAGLESGAAPFSHACFKWVLANPHVSGLLVTVRNAEELDEFAAASGLSYRPPDARVLAEYAAAYRQGTCRIGCGDCLDHCPHGVAVPTLMRYRLYHEAYGAGESARAAYAELPIAMQPNLCATCAAPCAAACAHGVDIRGMMVQTRALLGSSA